MYFSASPFTRDYDSSPRGEAHGSEQSPGKCLMVDVAPRSLRSAGRLTREVITFPIFPAQLLPHKAKHHV
jgi:hypothetical protein